MLEQELKDICKKLKPLLGRRADALWAAYVTAETPDSKREAEALIQMFGLRHLSRTVSDQSVLLPPPTEYAARGEFFLGTIFYGNKPLYPLYLRSKHFVKHAGIFSITGGGKTNVAQILALGLLEHEVPFLVVDWKRSYRALFTLSHPRVRGIRIYSVGRKTASPLHWNPLRGPPGVHPKTWISVVAEALEKSHISGPGVADIFIELLDRKFAEFGFYDAVPDKYPNFFDAAEELERVQYKGRRMLWQDSCSRILKTFTFGPAAGAFNARHPIKWRSCLKSRSSSNWTRNCPSRCASSCRTSFSAGFIFIGWARARPTISDTSRSWRRRTTCFPRAWRSASPATAWRTCSGKSEASAKDW
jgi:hypothetical protein